MVQDLISLPDGRSLGYALYGPMSGTRVFYFHGTPGSRLEPGMLHAYGVDPEKAAKRAGLQLVAVDRPGMGLSTFNPKGTLLSFADDVQVLAQHLSMEKTAVLCWSGGGPFGLALAYRHPRLVQHVHILCGFSRQFTPEVTAGMYRNRWYFEAARRAPWLLSGLLGAISNRQPGFTVPQWLTGLSKPDQKLIRKPELLQNMTRHSLREACRNGAAGPVFEAGLYFQPYGFSLSDVAQPVHYWWGTLDRLVTGIHADAAANALPNSILFQVKGEGHLSLYVRYFAVSLQQMATTLAGAR